MRSLCKVPHVVILNKYKFRAYDLIRFAWLSQAQCSHHTSWKKTEVLTHNAWQAEFPTPSRYWRATKHWSKAPILNIWNFPKYWFLALIFQPPTPYGRWSAQMTRIFPCVLFWMKKSMRKATWMFFPWSWYHQHDCPMTSRRHYKIFRNKITQCFFLSETKRLFGLLEGSISFLALSVGELWPNMSESLVQVARVLNSYFAATKITTSFQTRWSRRINTWNILSFRYSNDCSTVLKLLKQQSQRLWL